MNPPHRVYLFKMEFFDTADQFEQLSRSLWCSLKELEMFLKICTLHYAQTSLLARDVLFFVIM
jgi:hypothetical protein